MTQTIAYLEAVVGADITDFRRGMQDVRRESGILSDTFSGIAGGFSRAGRALTFAITTPIIAAMGASINLASEFDGTMRNINSIAQLPEAQLKALSDQVLAFGMNTRDGANSAAKALYEIYSANITGAAAFTLMEEAVRLSEGGLSGLDVTARALTATISAFSKQGLTAGDASNIWTRMVQMGVGSLEEFLSGAQAVLPSAAMLGISFENVAANAAYLSQQGGGASKAMTAISQAMNNLLRPNLTMQAAFKKLGVTTGAELITKFGSLEDAIKALHGAADSEVDFSKMFSKRGSDYVNTVINNFDKLKLSIAQFSDGLDNATMSAWEQQMKSFPAIMDRMGSALEGLGIVIGTVILPMLIPIIEGFTKFVLQLSQTSPELLKLAVGFALVLALAGPVLWIIGSLLSPLGLVMGAVGLLAGAFTTNFMGIRDTVSGAVSTVMGDLTPLKDAISGFFNTLFDETETVNLAAVNTSVTVEKGTFGSRLSYAIETAWPAVEQALATIWDSITSWVSTTGVGLLDGVGGDVSNGIAGIFDSSASTGTGDGPLYQTIRGIFTTDIGAIGADIGGWFQTMFPDTVAGLQRVLANVGAWFQAEGIPTLLRSIGYGLGQLISAIPPLLVGVGKAIAEGLSGENVTGAMEGAGATFETVATGVGEAMVDSGLTAKIETFALNARAFIDVALINLALGVDSSFSTMGRGIRITINKFFTDLFGTAAALVAQIPEFLFPGGAAAKEGYQQAFNALTQSFAKSMHIDEFMNVIENQIGDAAHGGTLMISVADWKYGVYDFEFGSDNINAESIAAAMTSMGKSQLGVMVNQAMEEAMAGSALGLDNMEVLLPVAVQAGFLPENISANIGPEFADEMAYVIENAMADPSLTEAAKTTYQDFLNSIMGGTGLKTDGMSNDLLADTFGRGAIAGGSGGGLAQAIKANVESAFATVGASTDIKANMPIKPATDTDVSMAIGGTMIKVTQQIAKKGTVLEAAGATMTKDLATGMKSAATVSFAAGGDGDISTPVKTMTESMATSFAGLLSPASPTSVAFQIFVAILASGMARLMGMLFALGGAADYARNTLGGAFNNVAGAMAGSIGQIIGILNNLISTLNRVQTAAQAAATAIATAATTTPPVAPRTPGRASGGSAEGMTWVGERGPELVNFGQVGTVVTNAAVRNAMTGVGSGNAGGNTINVYGVQDVDKMLYELKRRGIVLA